jgi:hypothetical protein
MSRKRTRQSREERLRKQREYQAGLRERKRTGRCPERDDFARALFYYFAKESLGHPKLEARLLKALDRIVYLLVEQGFDRTSTDVALSRLLDRYEHGWEFRRKVHLTEKPMKLEHLIEDDDAGGR